MLARVAVVCANAGCGRAPTPKPSAPAPAPITVRVAAPAVDAGPAVEPLAPAPLVPSEAPQGPSRRKLPSPVVAAPMQMARVGPAVLAIDDTVYAIGGENAEGPLRSMETWSADRDEWSADATMKVPRVRHTATAL